MSAGPVVIVGAGPAGLAAALELGRRGVADVLVLEREAMPGGIPRHAQHQGFGLRDLRRPLSGPSYARRYAELAAAAGAELRTETMVTGWAPGGPLELTGPRGREQLEPAAVVLATGCRERPRSARLVPGSRPEGVMTTSTLQQLVYLKGMSPGTRALVVGAEHVSFSALLTLAHGGARAVGMVTELPRHQTLALFRAGAAMRFRTPVWTRTAVSAIHGRPRVEEVELTDLDSGATRSVECDTVVFSADWIPDHELAVMAGIAMDAGTRGPAVDTALRTSRPASSPPATCCTAPRPPTWPRSAVATRVPPPRRTWRTAAPGRRRACRSSASRRSGGSLPTPSWRMRGRHHEDASRFARRASCSAPAWRSPRPAARSGRVVSGAWSQAAPPLCRMRGPPRSIRPGVR